MKFDSTADVTGGQWGFGSIGVGFGSIGVGFGFSAGGGGNIAVGLGLAACPAAGDTGEAEGVGEL